MLYLPRTGPTGTAHQNPLMLHTKFLPGRPGRCQPVFRLLPFLLFLLALARPAAAQAPATLDPAFAYSSGFNGSVYGLLLQPDGKILVGGAFTTYNGHAAPHLIRLLPDGTVDPAFNVGSGAGGAVYTFALQPDGKILVGGFFSTYGGVSAGRIVRLLADGSVDPSFQPGTGANQSVASILVLPDGRLLVGGGFLRFNGVAHFSILRLLANGSIDPSFSGNAEPSDYVQAMALQPDGSVVLGGYISGYNGIEQHNLLRITATGALDNSFAPDAATLPDWVDCVALQPDGRVLVGGDNWGIDPATPILLRVSSNGAVDNSFPAIAVDGGSVYALALQPDGKVLAGGTFQFVPQGLFALQTNITRLLADGSGDAAFAPGSGTNGEVSSLALQRDGRVLAGGLFTTYNGTPRARLLRVLGGPAISAGSLSGPICAGASLALPFTASGLTVGNVVTAQLSDANGSFATPLALGSQAATASGTMTVTIPATVSSGSHYRIRVLASAPALTGTDNGSDLQIWNNTIDALPNRVACTGDTLPALHFTGGSGSYHWTNDNTDINLAASGDGDLPSFIAFNPNNSLQTANIRVTATGNACPVRTAAFRIQVRPYPVVTINEPYYQFVCTGDTAAPRTFSSNLPNTVFMWRNSTPSIGLPATGTGFLPAFRVQGGQTTGQVLIWGIAGGCSGYPVTAINFYHINAGAGSIRYPATAYCAAGTASVTRAGLAGGSFSASPAGLVIDPATGTVDLAASQPGTYTIAYTVAATGSCAPVATTQLTVKANATVSPLPNAVYCSGMATGILAFSGTASSYSWTNSNPSIGLAAAGTGTALPSFNTVNAGPGAQYGTIRVQPLADAASCAGKAMSFRITVNYCGPVAGFGGGSGDASTARGAALQLSPNPAFSSTQLTLSGVAGGTYLVVVRNSSGQPVLPVQTVSGNTLTIATATLVPGLYVVEARNQRSGDVYRAVLSKL